MSTPITCRGLYNRSRCNFFSEEDTYLVHIGHLLDKAVKEYKITHGLFSEIVFQLKKKKVYTGTQHVYNDQKKLYSNVLYACEQNIDRLLPNITNLLDTYKYKNLVSGYIIGQINKIKTYNLHFSYKNATDTQKELDFFVLNNYIYNTVKKTINDCLVLSVPTDSYFIVNYDEKDYTIVKNYLNSLHDNQIRKRGEWCLRCRNNCKPTFINGYNRLETIW